MSSTASRASAKVALLRSLDQALGGVHYTITKTRKPPPPPPKKKSGSGTCLGPTVLRVGSSTWGRYVGIMWFQG